jgi:hypothetical protein
MGGVNYMKKLKLKRKLCCDNKGALEGLPLYLIILVVVAAVAIIIIFSYLSTLKTEELARIDVYIDGQKADPLETTEGQHEVYIIAIGDDGTKLDDVTITMTGAGVNTAKKTDSNGKADFGTLTFSIVSGNFDDVVIEASYEGGNVKSHVTESLLVSPA